MAANPSAIYDLPEFRALYRQAVVLVGAQAIYLRVGEADLAVAAHTTDGDLGVDPALLSDMPALETALAVAQLGDQGAG